MAWRTSILACSANLIFALSILGAQRLPGSHVRLVAGSLAQGPEYASGLSEEIVGKCRFPENGKQLLFEDFENRQDVETATLIHCRTYRRNRMAAPLSTEDLNCILASTRNLWDEMRGERIFITGGTGFFGCWLVESFLHVNRVEKLAAQATILTRDPAAFRQKCPHLASDPAITLLAGDVRDFAFPDGEYRFVIHAATETSAKQAAENPIGLLATILRGTERTLEFAATHGTEKFLLASSGAVYGAQPASITHLTEDYAGAPNPLITGSVYAEGKRAAELMCAAYAKTYGIACKIARGFAFVGPHLPLDAHFAIGNFIRDAMQGDVIRVNGDGTPRRSYMYGADLAVWLWTILFRGAPMEAFNVGSDRDLSILELAQAVAGAIRPSASVQVAREPQPGVPVQQYVPCTRKAAEQLGLRCSVSIQDAIVRTAAWYGDSSGSLR
jgi:dTDP-glucose 4,6-dehydratase